MITYKFIFFLLLSTILSQFVSAEDLENYCITKSNFPVINSTTYNTKTTQKITFSFKNETFYISFPKSGQRVFLTSNDEQSHLSTIHAPQYEFGSIENIRLTSDHWLWIDGGETDYIAKLNLTSATPFLTPAKPIPHLTSKPCPKWQFKYCQPAQSFYSSALGRIFIQGYQSTFFSSEHKTLEVINGEIKPAPLILQNARFLADLNNLNTALFKNPKGQILLYDGDTVTNLLMPNT